jgi:hypothetical protein
LIDDRDIWAAALLVVKRYGDDAMLEASERADPLLDGGDMAGAETWHRILNAIERLQAKAPAEGERTAGASQTERITSWRWRKNSTGRGKSWQLRLSFFRPGRFATWW